MGSNLWKEQHSGSLKLITEEKVLLCNNICKWLDRLKRLNQTYKFCQSSQKEPFPDSCIPWKVKLITKCGGSHEIIQI